jgi:hypothetical protein
MFDNLVWRKDRMLLEDLVFRIEYKKNDDWELGDECFVFYKDRALVEEYAHWFSGRDFGSPHIFELGIWDGGSVAFWCECLHPTKHVAIDLTERNDSKYFQRYTQTKRLQDRVRTYWGIDQADAATIRGIVAREFASPLDLVIDDASHLYGPSKTSFETLFPLLRQGGVYIIEDWAWAHTKEHQAPDSYFASESKSLTDLVCELVEVKGSSGVIASLTVLGGFVAVERGQIDTGVEGFRLEDHISRRPAPLKATSKYRRILEKLRLQ